MERKAMYPGSFDPTTKGHEWVMSQMSDQYDKGTVAIGVNPDKAGRFPIHERVEMISEILQQKNYSNLDVTTFTGIYQVDFAEAIGAKYVLRGVRNSNDALYESDLRHINRTINPKIETIVFIPPIELAQISSSTVIGLMGSEGWENVVEKMVSKPVFDRLLSKQKEIDWKLLNIRWERLMNGLGVKTDTRSVFQSVFDEYSKSHRAYHGLSHVKTCLNEFELVKNISEDPKSLELAIWFHDIVHEPSISTQDVDNEFESAEIAKKAIINDMKLSPKIAETVSNLIMQTKHTSSNYQNIDEKILVDVDLAILGRSQRLYDLFEKNIKKEYDWVPRDQFVIGRKKILQSILDRPTVYQTDFFRNRYENQARVNMQNAIKNLSLS
jgi:pantetheine-phosphate adenylyltransferase